MSKHTPTPWTFRNVEGAGLQLYGLLPKGFKFEATCYETDGEHPTRFVELSQPQRIMIGYERWLQFETKEWSEMQAANMALIVKAVNSHDALVEACKAFVEECESGTCEEYDLFFSDDSTCDCKQHKLYRLQKAAIPVPETLPDTQEANT